MPKVRTPSERKVLDFVAAYVRDHGYSPTLREVAAAQGWRSPNWAHEVVRGLAAQGLVTYRPGVGRTVRVVEGEGGADA